MGLILSGEDLIKTTEGYMRSACRKVNGQARFQLNTAYPVR